ncbi:IS6 family transposase [Bacillus thuringiensis serovar roskildiensis]|uniref:IS6 family transposase n=1 Tax=Bacillus thuringiensis serovar sooncheon TaxID=180891 RepID=A0A9Q5X207_BACTU|nr:IS6 family transposase [Bacillus thuringiensis]MEB9661604.1 IS6 family transposase [Bacillus cereus]ARV91141.1 IS6 family transposase [Bacillus thuringiensis]OTW68831.1 IS6 family transposase [Bacillus thuringiensis serovar coreanensis]OTX42673.1 IS6 family transposase [Bacillus thuringiensis serovar sooncheon]OTX54439.1 IS6 family transposase [Bacillus thuringiensis serovar guiyangiensis]
MKYFKFKQGIILVAVGYYYRFSLSYRDVSEILKERGISVHSTTIVRWLHEYDNLIYQIWKVKNKSARLSWHLDETYIKVKGKWRYLYRAIDKDGHTLDIQLRKKRDHQAAYAFIKRLGKHFGEPTVLTTDKAPALLCVFNKLRKQGFYQTTIHCTIKHLNNLIEQDHRHVKRRFARSAGFQNLRHASRTIKGIETIFVLYKKRRSLQRESAFSTYNELQQLLAIS